MRPGTGLHRHYARWPGGKEFKQLCSNQPFAEHHMAGRIRPMRLKTRFAMSNPIVLACPTDASSSGWSTPPLWHVDAVGGVHPITVTPAR
jgi:hypothetical protein